MDWANVLSDAIGTYGSIEVAKANKQPQYTAGQPAFTMPSTSGVSPLILLAGAGLVVLLLLKN